MKIILHLFFWGVSFHSVSQTCAVQTEALKGTYEGDCRNKKANGIGTAKGKDSYTGEFINGYPEGKGKYTWKNGDWYEGKWKKGKRDGMGDMHFIKKDSTDSLVSGFWQSDKYLRKYETPYIIHNITANMKKINVEFNSSTTNQIELIVATIVPTSGIASASSNYTVAKIDVIKGKYMYKETQGSTGGSPFGFSRMILKNVQFPFHAQFHVGKNNDVVEIEFLENGSFKVFTGIN